MEGAYRGQNCYYATQCDVGVSLHSAVNASSTVMALLCIPVSELVSFAFSTICPF